MPNKIIPINNEAPRVGGPRQKCQAIDSVTKRPVLVHGLTHEERESIATTLDIDPDAVNRLARRFGVGTNHIVSIYVEETKRRERKAVQSAYDAGRRSALPPHPPSQARRAA